MNFPESHDQHKIPAPHSASVTEIAKQVTSRLKVAELRLAKLNTSFCAEADYSHNQPLPLSFVSGVKTYLASPSVDIMKDWPPLPWRSKHGVQDAVENFRFDNTDEIDTLLARDNVIKALEAGLVAVSLHIPSPRKELAEWRGRLIGCHRLRTDEVYHMGAEVVETEESIVDQEWASIVVKLQESRPDGI